MVMKIQKIGYLMKTVVTGYGGSEDDDELEEEAGEMAANGTRSELKHRTQKEGGEMIHPAETGSPGTPDDTMSQLRTAEATSDEATQ